MKVNIPIDAKIELFQSDFLSEQYCHLLVSVGLDLLGLSLQNEHTYVAWIDRCLPNHYASQKLWLADDLAASISSKTDTKHLPDDEKIVLSVGVIDIHCTFGSICISCHLNLLSGARCQQEAWTEMFNNTSMPILLEEETEN